MTDIVDELRQGSLNNEDYRWKAADLIEHLYAALREWETAMNRLSMRVYITPKDIADVLNPIADNTRAVLGELK